MKKLTMMTLALGLCAMAVSPVMAGGFYGGASIGNTFFSSDYQDALNQVTEIDENSTSWKIFGGFTGGKFFGIEGGYRDFGTIETESTDLSVKTKTTGWDVEALGRFQIAFLDIFGKAGVMFWSNDGNIDSIEFDESGTDFMWGLGAGARLGPIGVRLEWESLEVDGPDNLSMVSLGATLGF